MVALGNIGTGNLSTVCIKEEPSLIGTIATCTPVDFMRNRAFFQRLPNMVESDFANAISDGLSKEAFHTTAGILSAQLDTDKVGWPLKWFIGTKTTTGPTDTTVYKHVFRPGVTTLKSCKVIQDVGGMSTPLLEDFPGSAIDRMAIIANILETVKLEMIWLGITNQPHNPIAITGATKANPCEITSTTHPLQTGDIINIYDIVGMTELNGNRYTITKTGTNTFTIGVNSSAYSTYTSGGYFEYTSNHITAATQANPCQITAPSHGFVTGDTIKISGVVGMTDLNGNTYTVTKVSADAFTIGVNSTTYGAYSSGGVFAYEGNYAAENKTVSYRDDSGNAAVKFYLGTAGADPTTSENNRWTDPYYMRLDTARNRKVDNLISDGTGKSAGISNGIFRATVNLITTLTTNQKYSIFRSGTEKAFGVILDTGTVVTGAGSTTNKLVIYFPRVTITNYDMNVDGIGTILPAVNLKPQKDPTLGYEVSFELYNGVSAYADST